MKGLSTFHLAIAHLGSLRMDYGVHMERARTSWREVSSKDAVPGRSYFSL